jgi:hypothetical protein
MPNRNLLTHAASLTHVDLVYYSPVAVIPTKSESPIINMYAFLSKIDDWTDEQDPPIPSKDIKSIKKIFKSIFAVKAIKTSDISPVIERVDWSSGTVYDYYRDDVDMVEKDSNGNLVRYFYIKNKYDQVFKCLWNNNGGEATDEPYFEPGTYSTNNIYKGSDGYKWKFVYTIDTGLKLKFMDARWIPIQVGSNTPNPLITSAGAGSLDVINVTNGGSGYDSSNAIISIVISGDGSGATATANVSANGVIQDIIVTNPGTNYTFANVSVTSAQGNGATLQTSTSPIGGHGFDPISELGCSHIMITSEFNSSENGLIPTDLDYHQLGIIINPTTRNRSPLPANGQVYSTTVDVVVAPGTDVGFQEDEFVYQGSITNPSFYGNVASFYPAQNLIKLINTVGNPSNNAPIFGQSSGSARTLLSYNLPNFVLLSGYIAYIENRTGIQRSDDGIEQIRLVLSY